MAATAWDTYAEQLMDQGHGYPLWDPEPTGNGEVEIGDVGFIRRGRFHRLFSARYTADHPLNETWGVPDDFVPLHIANGFIVEKQSAIASDSLHSGSFHKLAVGGEVHAGSATDISLLYQCVDDKGAVLVLPTKHANSQELLETGGVYKYIQRNHTSWYHFATEKADILVKKEDIIFVTGWTKTSRWAVGAFASGGKAVELSLTVGYEAHAHATFNLSSSTGSSKSWYQHSGPIPEAVDNDRPLSGQRTSERGRGRGRRNRGRSIPPSRKLDQCIFLRFCQCKERLRGILPSLLPKVINAAAGPKDDERDGEGDSESMSPQTTVESESYIESYPRTPQWYNPVDCVLDHILQNSDASVAIASTTDAAALARSMSTPVQDLPSALRSQGLDMIVSDGGRRCSGGGSCEVIF
ncbi:hypothetical protein DAEQUDRAFT_530732 [Daedalea quercina L-15889]|uniref:Uncharacterized protein n=1 Tax=Daedalea quercina L-15889 TaxID=1314783 RepID=A0A165M8G1_9APHY|nr:hypothetical protein DAEQUDRAFT_530732 [Daedalea quercina L-15889]